MDNDKINNLLKDLRSLKYNWRSGSDHYTSDVVNKEGIDRVEQIIRSFLLDNRDDEHVAMRAEIATLEAKVFMYEQIISKSNFSPMIPEHTPKNNED